MQDRILPDRGSGYQWRPTPGGLKRLQHPPIKRSPELHTLGRAVLELRARRGLSQEALGAEAGAGKKIIGAMLGKARDLADAARESDFLRLVGDIVMSRQAEDTFKTFRDGGRVLGNTHLSQIGEIGERHHDYYNREANALVQQMFVENVRGVEPASKTFETADTTLGA